MRTKKAMLLGVILLLMVLLGACAAPSVTPAPAPSVTPAPAPSVTPAPAPIPLKKITVADGPEILDLLSLLPPSFERLDAASEGMSLADMGIYDPMFCEVQLFLSDEPFQMVYCFLSISDSRIEQAGFDAIIRDHQQMEAVLIENIIAGAEEMGMELTVPEIQITEAHMGDATVFAEGQMETYGFMFGFDILWFRQQSAYVYLYSSYDSLERQALVPIAEAIEQRIAQYSH